MCGIFGISKKNINLEDYDKIIKDVDLYVEYNQKRGSDTFGLSFKLEDKVILYKANEKPSLAIKKKNYKDFLNNNFKTNLSENLLLIGQTRLVTNGSKFSYFNNQPLQTKNIVGVHNGIFANLDEN